MVWVCSVDSITRAAYGNAKSRVVALPYGLEGVTGGSGATIAAVAIAETSGWE